MAFLGIDSTRFQIAFSRHFMLDCFTALVSSIYLFLNGFGELSACQLLVVGGLEGLSFSSAPHFLQ